MTIANFKVESEYDIKKSKNAINEFIYKQYN